MTVGQNILNARKEAKLTQQELAAKTGIDYRQIGRWERNDITIGLDNLKKLAKALGKTLDELAGD